MKFIRTLAWIVILSSSCLLLQNACVDRCSRNIKTVEGVSK